MAQCLIPLWWRHNGRDDVSNHQPHHRLLTLLFRRRSKKRQSSTSLAFMRGIHREPVNSPHKWPVNAENVSIWWRHHALSDPWLVPVPQKEIMIKKVISSLIICCCCIYSSLRVYISSLQRCCCEVRSVCWKAYTAWIPELFDTYAGDTNGYYIPSRNANVRYIMSLGDTYLWKIIQ